MKHFFNTNFQQIQVCRTQLLCFWDISFRNDDFNHLINFTCSTDVYNILQASVLVATATVTAIFYSSRSLSLPQKLIEQNGGNGKCYSQLQLPSFAYLGPLVVNRIGASNSCQAVFLWLPWLNRVLPLNCYTAQPRIALAKEYQLKGMARYS